MIQRIQTIYLLIAALCVSSVFVLGAYFLYVTGIQSPQDVMMTPILADSQYVIDDSLPLEIMTGICGGLALICIFLYNNRKLQITITNIVILLIIAIYGFIAWSFYQEFQNIQSASTEIVFGWGLLPFGMAIIPLIMAAKAIKKDEKLVRSADRLR